ncbi:hypothetical protein V494_02784 [Pseudogymnoascus sp. VKM F-4513 (FW-928)]|nr:hypothetical protein V494_02784 [Pseudogymnoascus sp. VKM F-4513 (FW-928)]
MQRSQSSSSSGSNGGGGFNGGGGMVQRSSRSPSPTLPAHSNVPYTLEQVHFIQYYREDKGVQWEAIVIPFKKQFPQVRFKPSTGPNRGKGALECRYYRAQMFPKLDDAGNLVLDENGEPEMVNIKVRERTSHRHRNIIEDYFKLVTRCPEMVLEYSWTDEKDKEEARRIIRERAAKGIGRLRGDIIRVRSTLEAM